MRGTRNTGRSAGFAESCRDEARPPGRDVARARRGGVGVRHAEPRDQEPGEPQGEDEPCGKGCPAMTSSEGAVQDHPWNRGGDPYERREEQQSHAVGRCVDADVTSRPCPPDGSSGHHRGQSTEEDPEAGTSGPAARRTRRLCSHGHRLASPRRRPTTSPVAGPPAWLPCGCGFPFCRSLTRGSCGPSTRRGGASWRCRRPSRRPPRP